MKKLHITDILGQRNEVTDLANVLEQSKMYAEWTQASPTYFAAGVTCQQYWQDAYEKLLKLSETLQ